MTDKEIDNNQILVQYSMFPNASIVSKLKVKACWALSNGSSLGMKYISSSCKSFLCFFLVDVSLIHQKKGFSDTFWSNGKIHIFSLFRLNKFLYGGRYD
jgi:hypothetical protein